MKIDGTWIKDGANLDESVKQDKSSVFEQVGLKEGVKVGAKLGHKEMKGHSWISSENSLLRILLSMLKISAKPQPVWI